MKSGNVLSEYGILLGLLAIVCIGALTLLGNSKAQLLSNLGQSTSSSTVQNMMKINFGDSNQGVSGQGSGTGSTSQGLHNNITGGGVNVTSEEGQKRAITLQTISYANELEAIANTLPDGSDLQLWLTMDLIPRVRSLAAVEGYASNISTLHDQISGSYDDKAAFADLTEIRNQLVMRTQNFSYAQPGDKYARAVYPSPELKATVVGILNQAVEGTKTFGITSEPGPVTWEIKIAKAYSPNTSNTGDVNAPYSQSAGYLSIVQSVQQAQVDGSINQNTETATNAEGADKMENTAEQLP